MCRTVSCLLGCLLVSGPVAGIELELDRRQLARGERLTLRIAGSVEPGEGGMVVSITGPDGKCRELAGFEHQPFRRRVLPRGGRPADWIHPEGPPRWEARFTPMQAGDYRVAARLLRDGAWLESPPVSFQVTPSDHPGFLRVREDVPRFLAFDDGTPFFAIGQNLAYFGEDQYLNIARAEPVMRNLAAAGVNYLRVWTCCQDWAMSLEDRKSAWGRSWGWNPPFVADPANPAGARCVQLGGGFPDTQHVSPCHPVAVIPDTVYLLGGECLLDADAELGITCGGTALGVEHRPGGRWGRFECRLQTGPAQQWLDELTIRLKEKRGIARLRSLSMVEQGGGANLLHEAAIDQPRRGVVNPVDAFMLDEIVALAEREGIYLQLCLLVRDPYTGDLKEPDSPAYQAATGTARRMLGYIVSRWGWSSHVAAWEYFNEADPGLPTGPFYQELADHLDDVDPYRHPRTTSTWSPSPKDWRSAALDIAQTHHYIRPANGPAEHDVVQALLGQLRPMLRQSGNKPVMIGEFGLADDQWRLSPFMAQDTDLVHFHRALWASTMSGAAGTAMFWWWKELVAQNAFPHYRSLADFIDLASFPDPALATFERDLGEVRVLGWAGPRRMIAWLSDRRADWHARVVEGQPAREIGGLEVTPDGITPGIYQVTWWDTRRGVAIAGQRVEVRDPPAGLPVPAFTGDIALLVSPVK